LTFAPPQAEWNPKFKEPEGTYMPQTEKPLVQTVDLSQSASINVVTLGAGDILQGRLKVEGDLKIAGKVEGELKASGDVTIDSSASVQASIEGSNVNVRGQVTGNLTARHRLTLGGKGRLNGDVKVGRLSVEDGTTLNGSVTMSREKS
jgi:cytoskeletal protein CcmA (bactofilin family)